MIHVTGDVHTQINDLIDRCIENNVKKGDTLVIVGDVGANFFQDMRDLIFKERANELGITMLCIHGNHEIRPEHIESYEIKEWNGGKVYFEKEYPNLLFAIDGEIYNIEGQKALAIGGAYSVDKYYRAFKTALYMPFFISSDEIDVLEKIVRAPKDAPYDSDLKKQADKIVKKIPANAMFWWRDEQPSSEIKKKCEEKLEEHNWEVDIVFSHTSPERFEPKEMFLSNLNQSYVDKSTERWLNKIEKKLTYKCWYAGHYHTEKQVNDKFKFLYNDVIVLQCGKEKASTIQEKDSLKEER